MLILGSNLPARDVADLQKRLLDRFMHGRATDDEAAVLASWDLVTQCPYGDAALTRKGQEFLHGHGRRKEGAWTSSR